MGKDREYTFEGVGRTAPEDYLCHGLPVQSKFNNGIENTLNAIKGHLGKYPDFLAKGGSYDIPKDRYSEIVELLSKKNFELSSTQYAFVQKVRALEIETGIRFGENVKPSIPSYAEVQQGAIQSTIAKEEEQIKATNQEIRNLAYQESKPNFLQGGQVAVVGATLEGGVSFCLAIVKKRKEGKKLSSFTIEDWKEIGMDTGVGTLKGGIRGASVYALANFTATPANVASALTSATFGVISQASALHQGNITPEDFIINSEALCLDVSISAISSLIGQIAIPVPVLGALVGNAAGMFLYGIAKEHCGKIEQSYIDNYRYDLSLLNDQLDAQYRQFVERLDKEFKKFKIITDLAFDLNVNISFENSIELARKAGVSESKILKSKHEINQFFLS